MKALPQPSVQSNPNWRSSENQLNTNRIGGPPELEVRQIKYDIGTEILTLAARHLNKIMFCRKIENKKQNKFENRNEIKNKKYNNGKQIELGQMIKFKTNGKIWGRIQKESKNIGKTTTYTHFRIFRFPIFDTHPRLSFIRFQFYHFSILWFAIPNFDFQIFDTFKIHVSIIHLSTCRFSFSAFWCLISGFRFTSVWHFHKSCFILCLLDFPISHL